MNIFTFSAILLAHIFALISCSASVAIEARQTVVAVYVLTGDSPSGTPYPNYTVSVPENSITIAISKSPSNHARAIIAAYPQRYLATQLIQTPDKQQIP